MLDRKEGGELKVMRGPQQSAIESDVCDEPSRSPVFLTDSYSNALDRLSASFSHERPLAILIGEGKSASSLVLGTFLQGLDEEVTTARIMEPCSDVTEFKRRLVSAVGFKTTDMDVVDLDSIFKMFLSFQKGHNRRTILCIDEIQDCEWWVLDRIRTLVEMENQGRFGLMVIISGQPSLKELLRTRPLSAIDAHAGQRISLAPLTLSDTTEYIRRRVEAAGTATIDQVFQYHAILAIHELCDGVPDDVSMLISECLELADEEGVDLVTTELVQRACDVMRLGPPAQNDDILATTVNINGAMPRISRLIIQLSGEDVREKVMRQGHILIGRSELCDVRISGTTVSRHHALINYSSAGATLVDLSSMNGTYVDGCQIKEHKLEPGETITLGDCKIEYVVDDDLQRSFQKANSATTFTRRVPVSGVC